MLKPGQRTSTNTELIERVLLDHEFPEDMGSTDIACWYVGSENRGYSQADMDRRNAWLEQYREPLPTSGLVLRVVNHLVDMGVLVRDRQLKISKK